MGSNAGLNSAGRVGQKRLSGKRLQGEIYVRLQASATPCRNYAPVTILAGLGAYPCRPISGIGCSFGERTAKTPSSERQSPF
jgi:hypothetical protein